MTETLTAYPGRSAANAAWRRDGKRSPLAGLGAALRRSKKPAPPTQASTRDARYADAKIVSDAAWRVAHRKPDPRPTPRYWPHQSLRETSRRQRQIAKGVLRWPAVWTAKVSPAELFEAISAGKVL